MPSGINIKRLYAGLSITLPSIRQCIFFFWSGFSKEMSFIWKPLSPVSISSKSTDLSRLSIGSNCNVNERLQDTGIYSLLSNFIPVARIRRYIFPVCLPFSTEEDAMLTHELGRLYISPLITTAVSETSTWYNSSASVVRAPVAGYSITLVCAETEIPIRTIPTANSVFLILFSYFIFHCPSVRVVLSKFTPILTTLRWSIS